MFIYLYSTACLYNKSSEGVNSSRQPRDVPHSCICISLSATKTCRDNWLYHVHTSYIHVHTWFIHVHTMYMSTNYFMHVPLR